MKKSSPVIAENRRAHFDYSILEHYQAGIVLTGNEIKSVRAKRVDLSAAYVKVINGEVWLINAVFSDLPEQGRSKTRKLLLHHREIDRLIGLTQQKGLALIAERLYFTHGLAKLDFGVGRGKKEYDKRQTIKERDIKREEQIKDRRLN